MSLSMHTGFGSSSTDSSGRSERLTAEEEKDMARAIRRAEEAARGAIAGIAMAEEILKRRPERAERTRAGAVDRLEEAVMVVVTAARKDVALKAHSRKASAAWQ